MVNFYDLLGISIDATPEQILRAFRQKATVYHPDHNNGSAASDAMFKMLTLAKETLLDEKKRLEHDYAVGVKDRPEPLPRRIVRKEVDPGQVVAWSLLAFIVGLALGGSKS